MELVVFGCLVCLEKEPITRGQKLPVHCQAQPYDGSPTRSRYWAVRVSPNTEILSYTKTRKKKPKTCVAGTFWNIGFARLLLRKCLHAEAHAKAAPSGSGICPCNKVPRTVNVVMNPCYLTPLTIQGPTQASKRAVSSSSDLCLHHQLHCA